jgi:uncharacterized repeat protein (TIGR04076 family)
MKEKILIKVIDRLGKKECDRGHKIGDCFDFDTERGNLCPRAMHCALPYIDIIRYGGKLPLSQEGDIRFYCPDAETALILKLEIVKPKK